MRQPLKPRALRSGDAVGVLSLASPVEQCLLAKGQSEIERVGYVPKVDCATVLAREGYFAGSESARLEALRKGLADPSIGALFCSRGGYGSNYLLPGLNVASCTPKIILGYSDITSLQIFLWQKFGWVTFYGPMVASNFDHGAGGAHGYDRESLLHALTGTERGWALDLQGESLVTGEAQGVLLGGCLTLIETSLGTPWELDTTGAVLVLEDRGMKPYQVDRALMHLKQAGKFEGVAGIVLGDFPDCQAADGDETVRDVAQRILEPLKLPLVWGAPIGHTERAALTVPLGVRGKLSVSSGGDKPARLEIPEPACTP